MLMGSSVYTCVHNDFDITIPCDRFEKFNVTCVNRETGECVTIEPETKEFTIIDGDTVNVCSKAFFRLPYDYLLLMVPVYFNGRVPLPASPKHVYEHGQRRVTYSLDNAKGKWAVVNSKPERVYKYDLQEYTPLYNNASILQSHHTELLDWKERLGKVEFYSRLGISTHPRSYGNTFVRNPASGFLPDNVTMNHVRQRFGADKSTALLHQFDRDSFKAYLTGLEYRHGCKLALDAVSKDDHAFFVPCDREINIEALKKGIVAPIPGSVRG